MWSQSCDFLNPVEALKESDTKVQERMKPKRPITNKKYGSLRCPSCNCVLGPSYHYCWQCGQKILQNSPPSLSLTNLDCVHSMNAEELAEWVFHTALRVGTEHVDSELGLIEWLKQPVKGE